MIIQGIRNTYSGISISTFNPTIAKYIYETYAPQNGVVYDFSFGFGQRVLGAMASSKNLTYHGVDPWEETHENVQDMINFVDEKMIDCKDRVFLYNAGSESFCPDNLKNTVDLAFSSPPYYKTEMYDEDPRQANSRDYDYFINTYWKQTCANIQSMLKQDGRFILNIAETCDGFSTLDDMLRIAGKNNFVEEDRLYICLTKNINFRDIGEIKLEPVVVMKKI
jgi:tRNA1(Val) A37 N6-methylase TrmN6